MSADTFRKERDGITGAGFAAEAAGLAWLAATGAVQVPVVRGHGAGPPAWIEMERFEPGTLSTGGAERLGRGLADMHRAGAPAFGALPPGSPDAVLRLGLLELPMAERAHWPGLYAEGMLIPLVARARDAGTLEASDAGAIESVCERMGELAGPAERAARLHGDLWSGNVLALPDGEAALIDPAAYGGHREVDLAMLRLFGSPSERIFAAYEEAWPLPSGHAERVELWQLLPLLVHAVLFGGHYGAAAGRAARRYF